MVVGRQFYPRGTQLIVSNEQECLGLTACLFALEARKHSCSCRESKYELGRPAVV